MPSLDRSMLARHVAISLGLFTVIWALLPARAIAPAPLPQSVPDMTGEYEFLKPDDTLAILEEEGKLKGYIDVMQGEEESSDILSYQITVGTRGGDHVEFKTAKIHEKYYQFKGSVARGAGHAPQDPDFLRLTGDLDIVTVDSISGQEHPESHHVVLKWKPRSENDDE